MEKHRILVIDDDKNLLKLIDESLRKILLFPIDVNLFEDAESALLKCSETSNDLVIVDYKLHGMNGFHFIDEFQKLKGTNTTPIIFISGFFSDADKAYSTLKNENVTFLDKPFKLEDLCKVVLDLVKKI